MGRVLLCDVRRMETENVEFFWTSFYGNFLISVVSIYIRRINIIRINLITNWLTTEMIPFVVKYLIEIIGRIPCGLINRFISWWRY